MEVAEYYYESGNAPHEALGRAARRLSSGGALYLGGGVGIEKQVTKQGDRYSIMQAGGKPETATGPLSAVMRAFALAGSSTAPDTPGGSAKITDPAAAARLRELNDEEKDLQRRIERMESRVKAKQEGTIPSPNVVRDSEWEARELAEDRKRLSQLQAERKRLIETGKVEEVEQARPGTNFTKIPAKNVKRLSPIIKHYRGMAHPFSTCVRDQMKHGLSRDHANRRCAVVKDLGQGSTAWHGKKSKLKEAHDEAIVAERVRECEQRLGAIDAALGAGMAVELAERAGGFDDEKLNALGEQAFADLGQLFLAGQSFGVMWQETREMRVSERFDPDQPRDFLGRWKKTLMGLQVGGSTKLPDGITVTRKQDGFHVTGGGGTRNVAQRAAGGPPDTKVDSPEKAFQLATTRSARSTHRHSIGGTKSYEGVKDFERAQDEGTGITRHDQANNVSPHSPSEAPRKDREAYELLRSGRSLSVDEQRAAYAHAIRHGNDEARSILTGALRKQKKQKVEGLPRIGKTPRQRAISVGATRRAQQVAQDRHRANEAKRGRSESELSALRQNFEKMGKSPLAQVIADLEREGDDPQALAAAKAAMAGKGAPSARRGQDLSPQESAADRVAVKRKLRAAKPGETVTLPNGTKVEKMSNGNYVANGHNVGPNLDQASEVAAAAERVKAKRSARSTGQRELSLSELHHKRREVVAKIKAAADRKDEAERRRLRRTELDPIDRQIMARAGRERDTTPGIADSPGESARDIEARRNFERSRGPKAASEKPRPGAEERKKANRAIKNFASVVERAKAGGSGRNAGASQDAAKRNYEQAIRAFVEVEDKHGVDAVDSGQQDRLMSLRRKAVQRGLMSNGDAIAIEKKVAGFGESAAETRKRAQGKRVREAEEPAPVMGALLEGARR